jgi:hypothetical protein
MSKVLGYVAIRGIERGCKCCAASALAEIRIDYSYLMTISGRLLPKKVLIITPIEYTLTGSNRRSIS